MSCRLPFHEGSLEFIQQRRVPLKYLRWCWMCGRFRWKLPYKTPNDPPFYPPGDDNWHCEDCELWLRYSQHG